MKAYIVASDVEFTMMCVASSQDSALAKAAKLSMEKYGFVVDGLTAYEAIDYLENDPDGIEIELV